MIWGIFGSVGGAESVLIISPIIVRVSSLGTQTFTASGGSGTGYVYAITVNNSGGSINSSTGVYTAGLIIGVSDTVTVTDSDSNTASATVDVNPPLSLTPASSSAPVLTTLQFTGVGGVPPYQYGLGVNSSGGGIASATGAYTAGPIGGTAPSNFIANTTVLIQDTVLVRDSLGAIATATVAVTALDQTAGYADSKGTHGAVFPDGGQLDPNGWDRSAPLITADEVIQKHLFGISLVSPIIDPITRKAQVFTKEMINDIIDDAVAIAESETGLTILPQQFSKPIAYDRVKYRSLGFMTLPNRPVASIESLVLTSPANVDLFLIPNTWIETSRLHEGQLNLIPLTIALSKGGNIVSTAPTPGAAGAAALLTLLYSDWVPGLFRCTYTAGFPSGKIPKMLNSLLGVISAMEILSMLAATYGRVQSGSLSIDSLSQSSSGPGPMIFATRLKELAEKRKTLTKKIKTMYGSVMMVGVL